MFPNADRSVGIVAELQGLRVHGRPSSRRRHHQCAIARAGHFRNRSTGCSVQKRQADRSVGFTQAGATATTLSIDASRGIAHGQGNRVNYCVTRGWSAESALILLVAGSNPTGRARQINDLVKSSESAPRSKLTINSPTKRWCWRVIGGDSATAERLVVLRVGFGGNREGCRRGANAKVRGSNPGRAGKINNLNRGTRYSSRRFLLSKHTKQLG